MQREAVGLIETVGLTAAIEAADTAVKSANVRLGGYELTKGSGMVTVKIEGAVGAVKAAVEAARASAVGVSQVYAVHVIPRPAPGVDSMIHSPETAGAVERAADGRAAIDETAPAKDARPSDSQDDFPAVEAADADAEMGEPEIPVPQSPEDAAPAAVPETTESTPKDGRKKNKGLKTQETAAKGGTAFEISPP